MRKKFSVLLIASSVVFSGYFIKDIDLNACVAQELHYNNETSILAQNHYEKGMEYLRSGQYTNAINELKQALEQEPNNASIRNNLSVAYTSRATDAYNNNFNSTQIANDFRYALYYLKYFDNPVITGTMQDNIKINEENLNNFLAMIKADFTPIARYRMAKELRGEGEFIPAIIEFEYAATDPQLAVQCYESIGDIMRVLQNESKAAEYYDKALALGTGSPDLHLKFARTLNKLGNKDLAIKQYNVALKSDKNSKEVLAALEDIWRKQVILTPNDPMAHMNLGVILQKKGDYNQAFAAYKEAERLNPENPDIRLNLATLYQAQGNMDMALKAYDSILQVYPDNKLARFYKATALRKIGQIRPAIQEFEVALSLDPSNKEVRDALFETISKDLPAEESLQMLNNIAIANPKDEFILYTYAYQLHSNGRTDEALGIYNRVLALNPKNIDAYINIASIYKARSMNDLAASTLQKALAISPNNDKVKKLIKEIEQDSVLKQYEVASKKYDEGDYEGALKLYQMIKNPDASVYAGIGACYQALNKYDKAIEAYNKSISIDASEPTTYAYLASVYFSKNDLAKAEEYYLKAQKLDPSNADVKEGLKAVKMAKLSNMLEKALNLYNSKKYTEAMTLLNQVIAADSKNAYAYYYRAMVYDAQNKYELAIKDYLKAVENSTELSIAYYSLAVDYDMLNNKVEAKKAYQKFLAQSKGEENEYTKYARKRLQELK